MVKRMSVELAQKKYVQVGQLIKEGKSMDLSCKETGLSKSTYYGYLRREGKTKKKIKTRSRSYVKQVSVETLPEPQKRRDAMVLVMGDPASLAEFLRSQS